MRLRSILFNISLFASLLSFAIAFWLSLAFFGGSIDYSHMVDSPYTADDVSRFLTLVFEFGVLPLTAPLVLSITEFIVERKARLEKSYGLMFLILGILALLWGAFHLLVAIRTYTLAVGLVNNNHLTSQYGFVVTIFRAYGLGVGAPWMVTGALLLIFAYKSSRFWNGQVRVFPFRTSLRQTRLGSCLCFRA